MLRIGLFCVFTQLQQEAEIKTLKQARKRQISKTVGTQASSSELPPVQQLSKRRNSIKILNAIMGNCFSSDVPKRVQLSEAHLLGQGSKSTHHHQQQQYNLTDSEQHEFQYREIEHSITHNSNLNPVVPSNNSSPKHRPIKSNQMIYGNLNEGSNKTQQLQQINYAKLNHELQRQIDILKQCSNDEIKMLKNRIQFLEKQFEEMSINKTMDINDEDKEDDNILFQLKCDGKTTPIKSCPNILRIVKIAQLYNKIVASGKV